MRLIKLTDKIKKSYRKYVLPSKLDFVFHLIFGFQTAYLLLILVFLVEQFFNIFEFGTNQVIILFYSGLGLSIIIVSAFLYKLFHWLDDIDETHNQFALSFGVGFAVILFMYLDYLNVQIDFIWIDLGIILFSIILNLGIFWRFTRNLYTITIEFIKEIK